jgi:hypothetical protein
MKVWDDMAAYAKCQEGRRDRGNTNSETAMDSFGHCDFGFYSDFGYSDFGFPIRKL